MAIRFSKYVRIVSGVAGNSGIRQRDLIGRLFTQSNLIGTDEVLEFADAASVGEFFGFESEEYRRAAFYFSWTSPSITAARRISFARFAPSGAPIRIIGDGEATASLATLQAITAGSLTFQFGNDAPIVLTGIDLSATASFAAVAAALQAELNADSDPNLATSVVSFNATTGAFEFMNGLVQAGTVSLPADSPLKTALGWDAIGTRFVNGSAAQSAVQAVATSVNVSDNFGSLAFIGGDLTLENVETVAAYVAGQNVRFMYMVPLRDAADALDWSEALIGYAGTAVTYAPNTAQFAEQIPMMILAATDYSRANAVMNYMFKSFGGLTPSVTDDALSDELDSLRINYYGRTQTAGQTIDFYQRGFLMGTTSDPLDMNVYGNEQWLKDAIGAALMGLLVSTNRVPANNSGKGLILAIVQDGIDAALRNGTISVGKPLTTENKLFITQQTGDPNAWQQVQNVGYWVDCVIERDPSQTPAQWKATYILIYSKDDAIRFVEGTHFLI